MAENEIKPEDLNTWLNQNVITKGKIRGIPKRNIYEAVFFTTTATLIIGSIHFTQIVTIISLIVLIPIIFLLTIRGIKNRSVLSILVAEIKFHKNRRILHLRSAEYVRKENKYAKEENCDESVIETIIRITKNKLINFIDEYSGQDSISK